MKRSIRLIPLAAASLLLVVPALRAAEPQAVYASTCAACHATGVANAPKLGDAAEWQRRLQRGGQAALIDAAIKGRGAMPPKGGNAALSDADVRATVLFMLGQSGGAGAAPAAAAKPAPAAAAAPASRTRSAHPGQATYDLACAPCHKTGVLGSPRLDDAAAWAPRLVAGAAALQANAINGKGSMPPKGANPNLRDEDVRAAVDYMIAQVQPRVAATASAPKAAAASAAKATAPAAKAAAATDGGRGASVYQASCSACHAAGVAGAPKVGDASAWSARIRAGTAALYASALKGKGTMPAKGGNAALPDADVRAAVDFMVAQSRGATAAAEAKPAAPAAAAAATAAPATTATTAAGASAPPSAAAGAVPASAMTPPAAPATPVTAATAAAASAATQSEVLAFNRLLRPPGKRNLPPAQDGIHDPTNDGTLKLQAPLEAYAALPRSVSGNQVDWVKALREQRIAPRADRLDPKADMTVMDLNIVREVKGSMPDVVFPHKQHTEWLDCANCHPAIFVPQKGANQISMAAILLGQKCGVCHGKVAFPVSECRMCHQRKKADAQTAAAGKP
jgi:c(7)-type cytochrome triheme protein